MFLYEVYRLYQLDRQSIDVVVRYSESKRRQLFHARYFKIALAALSFAIVATLITSLTLPYKKCLDKQGLRFNTVCIDCIVEGCDDCWLSGPKYCNLCRTGTFYNPETRQCQDCDNEPDAIVCRSCHLPNVTDTIQTECLDCNDGYRLGL